MSERTIDVIVLAAERRGEVNALAARHAVSHKCLVPIMGRPLIAHVVDVLANHPRVATISISIEPEGFAPIAEAVWSLVCPARLRVVPAAETIADSVTIAGRDLSGPIVVTTADNVMLGTRSIDAIADALRDADAAIAMAPRDAVLRAHPDGQRRFYRFCDGEYSNCNLYGLAGPEALSSAELFRGGGQFARKAGRMIAAFGIVNTLLMATGLLTLDAATRRLSSRLGLKLVPVRLEDGSQAIDVDNERTYAVTEVLLRQIPAPAAARKVLREVA